jgi:putative transposase
VKYDPAIHHRRSIRLKGFDYSQSGAYFVTMVTQGRASLFGTIENREMPLNDAGRMIVKWWNELPNKFPQITLGTFVVMPNHCHGIIIIEAHVPVGGDLRVSPGLFEDEKGGHVGPPQRPPQRPPQLPLQLPPQLPPQLSPQLPPQQSQDAPLSQMIQWFKTMTTNEYIHGVKELGWPRFDCKLWQRDYYEHIIRNEDEANRIHHYIESNPYNWAEDEENR